MREKIKKMKYRFLAIVLAIIKKINNGELEINSEQFDNEYENYKNLTDNSKKLEKLYDLLNLYIDYLIENSNIIYLN